MNHAPSEIIAKMMRDLSLFEPYDSDVWPLFETSMPEDPNNCACLYDTAPVEDGTLQKTSNRIEHWGIQLKVRHREYTEGWVKAKAAFDSLMAVSNQVVVVDEDSYLVHAATATAGVIPLGVELEGTKRRELFTVNFLATITQQ